MWTVDSGRAFRPEEWVRHVARHGQRHLAQARIESLEVHLRRIAVGLRHRGPRGARRRRRSSRCRRSPGRSTSHRRRQPGESTPRCRPSWPRWHHARSDRPATGPRPRPSRSRRASRRCERSHRARTGRPSGPVTSASCCVHPPDAAIASSVPSPPSASGQSSIASPERARPHPRASARATCTEVSEPLNESGATTTVRLRVIETVRGPRQR